MCYASPGPRCEAHAKERHAKLQAKTAATWQKVSAVEKEKSAMLKDNPKARETKEYQKLDDKHNVLFNTWKEQGDAASEADKEIDATRGGIKALTTQIMEHHNDGSSDAAIHHDYLMRRREAGEKIYNDRMLSYDIQNGTVDGRVPSPYGDEDGVKHLRNKTRKLKEEYDNSTNHVERDAIYEKYKVANKALDHAAKTRNYVTRGLISPYAASLRTNQKLLKQRVAESEKAQKEYKKANIARVERVAMIAEVKRQEVRAGRENSEDYSPEAKQKIAELKAESNAFNSKVYFPAEEAARNAQRNVFEVKNAISLGLPEEKPKASAKPTGDERFNRADGNYKNVISPALPKETTKVASKPSDEVRFNRADGNYKSASDEPKFNRADGNYKK